MPLDAIDRNGAGAASVHLDRLAAHLDRARHEYELAVACSDLAECRQILDRLDAVHLPLDLTRGLLKAAVERKEQQKRATGIHARKRLPSPTYDNRFRLATREDGSLVIQDGMAICEMVPGYFGFDKNYYEIVPVPAP